MSEHDAWRTELENIRGRLTTARESGDQQRITDAANAARETIEKHRPTSAPDTTAVERLLPLLDAALSAPSLELAQQALHPPPPPSMISFADMEMPEPPDWILDEVIYRGGIGLCIGEPKAGKTTAMRTLAHRIVTGAGHWLGRDLASGPVLYLDYENPPRLSRWLWWKLADKQPSTMKDLLILTDDAQGRDPFEVLEENLASIDKPVIAFVDGMAALIGGVADSPNAGYDEIVAAMVRLRRMAEKYDVAIVVQHHAPWKAQDQAGRQRAMGSVAYTGQADVVLSFDASEFTVESTIIRHGKGLPRTRLHQDDTGAVNSAPTGDDNGKGNGQQQQDEHAF